MADVNIGQLVTVTLRKRGKKLADNVTNHIPLLKQLKARGQVNEYTSGGGREITVPLEYGEQNYQRYSGFEQLDVQESKVFDAATYTPVQSAVPVAISGRDRRMNMGDAAAIKLVTSLVKNAERTMMNNIAVDVMSLGTLTNQIGGLQALIAIDPTSGVVGGIDRATYTWWRNKVRDVTTEFTTYDSEGVRRTWNKLFIDCTRGSDKPDTVVADGDMYEMYEAGLQANQRYMSEKEAEAGFQTLMFKGAKVYHDSTCPADTARFLNTNYLEFLTYPGANFEPTDNIRPYNQDASVQHLLFMGNLVMSNGSLQGVAKE